jgi:hypothetical protein
MQPLHITTAKQTPEGHFVPVSSDMPDLQTGTITIQLERVMP